MKDFKKLRIWQKGLEIAKEAYRFVSTFPKEEKYGLTSQITRAAVSIPSNIAEGGSRNSNKDQARFIEISLGSAYELETQVMIATNLNFGDQDIGNKLITLIIEEQKMLIGFDKLLRG